MTCPYCGSNNFNWARRCDHCTRPLSGSAQRPTVSAPAIPQQADAGQPATSQDTDSLEGQTLTFNGVSYTVLPRSRQIPEADVYPLRHQQSNLVVFEAKAFRCAPGTPEYAQIKEKPLKAFRTKAELSSSEDPAAKFWVVEEIYEQDGRLLGIQRAYREHPGPAYHEELMASANTLLKAGRHADAIRAYDRVLALNANQTAALCNKGLALASSGDIAAADACFQRCIAIDANDPAPYANAAACVGANGQSERATTILARLVQRYPYDFGNWLWLTETAIEHDTLDLVNGLVEPGLSVIAGLPVGERLRASIEQSRERWRVYSCALETALSRQLAKQWDAALLTLEQCVKLTKRNAVAEFNRSICFFNKGEFASCLDSLRSCHYRLAQIHGLASQLLWLLCAVSRAEWDGAFFIVRALEHRAKVPTDLPRIPVAAGLGRFAAKDLKLAQLDCLEDVPVDRIVAALDVLTGRSEQVAGDTAAIAALKERYTALAAV